MQHYDLLMVMPMLALLAWAAIHDVRTRRIPNLLTLILALSGLVLNAASIGPVSLSQACLGLLAGFGLTVGLFAIGAVGGGDVKLLAGIGAWLGPAGVLYVFLARAVIGMGIVLAQAAAQGRLRVLFRNSAVLVMGFVHARDTGIGPVAETGKAARSIDKPLPFAVPVFLATFLVVAGYLN